MMLMRDEICNIIINYSLIVTLQFIVYMPSFSYHMNEYDVKHSRK